jgi:hypothetical protein
MAGKVLSITVWLEGPLHDPCVIAHLIDGEIFSGRKVHIDIELVSESSMGNTVADWWGVGDSIPNCLVMDEVNSDRFYDLLTERLSHLWADNTIGIIEALKTNKRWYIVDLRAFIITVIFVFEQ